MSVLELSNEVAINYARAYIEPVAKLQRLKINNDWNSGHPKHNYGESTCEDSNEASKSYYYSWLVVMNEV